MTLERGERDGRKGGLRHNQRREEEATSGEEEPTKPAEDHQQPGNFQCRPLLPELTVSITVPLALAAVSFPEEKFFYKFQNKPKSKLLKIPGQYTRRELKQFRASNKSESIKRLQPENRFKETQTKSEHQAPGGAIRSERSEPT